MKSRTAIALAALSFALSMAATSAATASGASVAQSHDALDGLLAADRRFATEAARTPGIHGMAQMFAADAMVMAVPEPGFAVGSDQALERISKVVGATGLNGKASWAPVRAGISADGLQGFTVGYFNASKEGAEPFSAKYLAYWVKTPDGWRIRLYKFVPRDNAPIPATIFAPLVPPATVADASTSKDAADSLAAAEKAFSDAAQAGGLRENFKKFGRADSLHTLAGNELVVGNVAIGDAHPEGPSPLHWQADGVVVASSGDLGATYGFLDRNGPTPPGRLAKIPFFTIWSRKSPDAPWLYVVE